MNLNLKSITSTVTKNADMLGGLAGFLLGTDNPQTDLQSSIQNLMQGQVHFPDPAAITRFADTFLPPAIFAYAGGMVMESLLGGTGRQVGKAIQDGAVGYAIGSLGIHVLYGMTHANQGSNPNSPDYIPGTAKFNLKNAPTIGEARRYY